MDTVKEFLSSSKACLDLLLTPFYPNIVNQNVDLQGKRALVSGANVGLGKAIAQSLAAQGAEVYMLCRSQKKADAAKLEIVNNTGNDDVFVEVVDFGSLKSVGEFIERWGHREPRKRNIDILINNAGESFSPTGT